MGALVAFEVALRFESDGHPVAALFVSACAAPGRMGFEYLNGPEREVLSTVTDAFGIDPEFLGNPEFVARILPTLRSVRAIAGYTSPPTARVSCPIYAFIGDNDEFATLENVAEWSSRTTSEFAVRVFRGGHFYLNENLPALVTDIETKISHHSEGG